jgi:hypothetical protein
MTPYLSTSRARDVVVFLRFGAGMRHSIEKAVQLVHGMPREAASQRTYAAVRRCFHVAVVVTMITYFPCMARCEWWLAFVLRLTEVPRLVNNVDITPRSPSEHGGDAQSLKETYFRMPYWRAVS